jgi:hypothetical protein
MGLRSHAMEGAKHRAEEIVGQTTLEQAYFDARIERYRRGPCMDTGKSWSQS